MTRVVSVGTGLMPRTKRTKLAGWRAAQLKLSRTIGAFRLWVEAAPRKADTVGRVTQRQNVGSLGLFCALMLMLLGCTTALPTGIPVDPTAHVTAVLPHGTAAMCGGLSFVAALFCMLNRGRHGITMKPVQMPFETGKLSHARRAVPAPAFPVAQPSVSMLHSMQCRWWADASGAKVEHCS